MKKRIYLSIALVLALIMLIAACAPDAPTGGGANGDGNVADDNGSVTDDNGAATQPADGEIVFTLWNHRFEDFNVDFFTRVTEQYNALERGFYADITFVPGDVWDEQMTAALATGTSPDLRTMAYNQILSAVRNGEIMALNDLLPQSAFDDIYDTVLEMITVDGLVWAFPQLIEPSAMLFYRTDLFEEAGIAGPPTTWDEMIEVGIILRDAFPDMFALEIGEMPAMGWRSWGEQYATNGHLAINDNWDTPLLGEGYAAMAEYYARMFEERIVPTQFLAYYPDIAPFGSGQVVMKLCGSWGIAGIVNDFPEVADLFSVAPIPTRDGNQNVPTATNGGWTYAINSLSGNAEAAADWISFVLAGDPSIPAEFFEMSAFSKASPRRSVDEWIAQNVEPEDFPWAEAVAHVASRAIPEPMYPWDISAAVALMFEQVAIGGYSVDDAMAQAVATIEEVIRNQNLAGTNPRMP